MILADTSVWIDHLRKGEPVLAGLLEDGAVCVHPLVIGELACGNLRGRREILELLQLLPAATTASDAEALHLIEERSLHGSGVGYIDVLLLASVLLDGTLLWTRDARLAKVAGTLSVRFEPVG